MSRVAVGRLLLACLLVMCVAIGQAAAESNSAAKQARKGGKRPAADQKGPGDSTSPTAKTAPDQKKGDEKKPAAEKDSDGKKPPVEKEPASKPATQKLKKGPFRVEVALDGVFEAQNQTELFVRPQEWTGLSVLKAVEHGAVVKQGDLVLALDTEKIDRTIADLRTEMELNEVALKQAAAQLAAMDKLASLDDQTANRNRRIAEEDLKRFEELEEPLLTKVANYNLKSAHETVEYAEEEYRQLEKMYKADDLKEETEKIVLRRAQNGVERAKVLLDVAQAAHEDAVKLVIRARKRTPRTSPSGRGSMRNTPRSTCPCSWAGVAWIWKNSRLPATRAKRNSRSSSPIARR